MRKLVATGSEATQVQAEGAKTTHQHRDRHQQTKRRDMLVAKVLSTIAHFCVYSDGLGQLVTLKRGRWPGFGIGRVSLVSGGFVS